MHRSPQARRLLPLALGSCLALALLAPAPGAAEETAKYTKESRQAYEQQLAAGEISGVTVNKRLRWLHVTLKDGRHVVYIYPHKHEPEFAARLEAKHVPVTVLTPQVANKEARKVVHPHHKIRYIAGGILLAVLVIVGAVWLVNRRRRLATE